MFTVGVVLVIMGILMAIFLNSIVTFLFGLLLFAIGIVVASFAVVRRGSSARINRVSTYGQPKYEYDEVFVVGAKYLNDKSAIKDSTVGDPVRFVQEPKNEFDENALYVENISGQKLGYVAQNTMFQEMINDYIEREEPIYAEVDGVSAAGVTLHIEFYKDCAYKDNPENDKKVIGNKVQERLWS